jgi:tRNA_anti-like
MTIKKRTWLLAFTCLVLIIGAAAWYGYREFSRKTLSAESLEAEWKLSADTLVKQFERDEAKYTALYTGKVLEVSGSVKIVEGLPDGPVTVVLGGGLSDGSVRMVMDSTMKGAATTLLPNDNANIRGICIGYSPDELGLGADILFNRSVIIKN